MYEEQHYTDMVADGDIDAKQSIATANTTSRVDHILDFLDSNRNTTIRYHVSVMLLFIHSDAS